MAVTGVLAIQGDFEKHLEAIASLGPSAVEMQLVRTLEQLARVDRLIIPGGESTTVGLLLERFGLGSAIQQRARGGMPIWGTCMGMIMLARKVEDRSQYTLDLLDITVRRNAFGTQVHSFEDSVELISPFPGAPDVRSTLGVFIRAPIVTELGEGVEPLYRYQGQIVGVRQGNIWGTSFHPELTDDTSLHRAFVLAQ